MSDEPGANRKDHNIRCCVFVAGCRPPLPGRSPCWAEGPGSFPFTPELLRMSFRPRHWTTSRPQPAKAPGRPARGFLRWFDSLDSKDAKG